MNNNIIAPISGFLVFLVLSGLALAYPIQFNLQSNLPAGYVFTTFVANCADVSCSSFVNGTERTINSPANLNVYTVNGTGTVTWLELDYKDESLLPQIYRFQATNSSLNGPFTVQRNFQKKSVCEAEINKLELSSNSVSENNKLTVTANVQSAMGFPKDSQGRQFDFSMIPIPQNLKDIYSTRTNVTLNVKNATGQIISTDTKSVNPWINKSENISFEFTPTLQQNHTIEVVTEVADPACSSTNKKTSQANFTVTDSGPVAKAGGNRTVSQGEVVSFDGSSTVTSDTMLIFLWQFGDGFSDLGKQVNHTYVNSGVFTVTLKVVDADGQESADTAIVTVNRINHTPVADFTTSATSVAEGQSVQFTDASQSVDGFKSRFWDFGDGSNSTDTNPSHVFAQQGTYPVKLTVTDNDDETSVPKIVNITVTDTKPNPSFTSPASAEKNTSVTFTDTSTAYDGVKTRSWNFGDGNTLSINQSQATHTYQQNGTFTVSLTVRDNDDAEDSQAVSKQITIIEPAPQQPPQPPSQPATKDVAVSVLSFNKPSVYLFDQVTVKTNVTNLGSAAENVTVKFKEGLIDLDSKTVNLSAGEKKEVSFTWIPSTTGSKALTIESVPLSGETNTADNVQTGNVKVSSVQQNIALGFADPSRFPSSVQSKNTEFYIWVNIENTGTENLTDVKVILDAPLPIVDSKDHTLSNEKVFASIPSGKTETYLWKVAAGSVPSSVTPRVYIGTGSDKVEVSKPVSIQ